MSANPIFIGTPRASAGVISAANSNRDGTGTLVDILTAGAAGSKIDSVRIKATGTTTAGMVRLFLYDGTNNFLIREIAVSAITVSSSVASFDYTEALNITLPLNYKLRASTEKGETFHVSAFGGDF